MTLTNPRIERIKRDLHRALGPQRKARLLALLIDAYERLYREQTRATYRDAEQGELFAARK